MTDGSFLIPILTAHPQSHAAAGGGFIHTLIETNVINFLLAFGIIIYLCQKFNVLSYFDTRQNQITQSLKDAEARRDKALEELKTLEGRIKGLETEIDQILVESKQTAQSLSESIIENAKLESQRLLHNAQRRIELDQKNASRELEQRLTREAIYAAQAFLENSLTQDDKEQSIEQFIELLPELHQIEVKR